MSRRTLLWLVLLLALAGGLSAAFWPRPTLVDLAAVNRGALVVTVDEEAKTRVRDVFVISAPISGWLRRVDASVGDAVVAGETVVARIEPRDPSFLDPRSEAQARAAVRSAEAARSFAAAEMAQAEAELEFARTEMARARKLFERKIVAERSLDEARRGFRTARAALDTAKAALEMREHDLEQARAQLLSPLETMGRHGECACVDLPAPASGQILRVIQESAGPIEAGAAILEIGNAGDLEIESEVLSAEAVQIAPGQRVIIEEWGSPTPLNGRVRRVEPYGFTKVSALGIEEQRVKVIIDLTDPPEARGTLGHGFRVEVRVVLWESDDALKVPLAALFRLNDGWAAFVEVEGRAELREVMPGRRSGFEVEVASGLAEGDWVVLDPGGRIEAGARIARRD